MLLQNKKSTNKIRKRTKTQGQTRRRQRGAKVWDNDTNILEKDASSKMMKTNQKIVTPTLDLKKQNQNTCQTAPCTVTVTPKY
jgi:hypothetical protein